MFLVAGIAFVSGRGCLRTVAAELPSLGAGRAAVSRGSGISLGTKVRLAAPFVNVKDIILVAGNCFWYVIPPISQFLQVAFAGHWVIP